MKAAVPFIALTSGEPAGIGPDICIAAAGQALDARLLVIGDARMLIQRASAVGSDIEIRTVTDPESVQPHAAGLMQVLDVRVRREVEPGRLDKANAAYVLEVLRHGIALARDRPAAALVTAPVQKSIINEAGIAFTGHTEFLAAETAAKLPVMMLAAGDLRVALATTHVRLRDVPGALDIERLTQLLTIVDRELRDRFGIRRPRISVLGLNPHAGESGVLGDEERRIIAPAIQAAIARGIAAEGPLPADTAFTPEALDRCDVVVAMYHDQGLPVIKALAFGEVVNITLGLPIVRTSVDHGTALPLAGTGDARAASLDAAIRLAIDLATGSAA
ncbi:MAG TPA: 4-hydroxythreonine-4-phosphate dehydrogenase PdxA [Gammaproteobacteria bacterium]